MKNRYDETYFSAEHRFSIGNDLKTGGHYLSIPVSNRKVDYMEHYRLSNGEYNALRNDEPLALDFAESCRRRGRDRLVLQPGTDREVPR